MNQDTQNLYNISVLFVKNHLPPKLHNKPMKNMFTQRKEHGVANYAQINTKIKMIYRKMRIIYTLNLYISVKNV